MIGDYTNRYGAVAPAPKNDPRLLELVRCRALKTFYVGGGKLAAPGDVVQITRHDALSMQALGKVEII